MLAAQGKTHAFAIQELTIADALAGRDVCGKAKTGSGKILHERTNRRHLLEVKSSRRTRRLAGTTELAPADTKKVKKLLGR